ncbi:MAG: response regulator, partial [Campylobacterota bacterium]
MKLAIDKKGFVMDNSSIDPIATILIIEDNEDLQELEKFHLLKEGYKVIGLTSTKGAESILEEGVDLILVDRTLPRVEGSEFVSYLRDKGVTTPVMFVSAKDTDKEIEEGFLCGGDDYLRKPFNMKE